MAEQTVKKVVIAGGGTSGWCVAAALSQQLGALVDITLIESEEIGTVGVGEATFPTIRTFHKILDLDEREFLGVTRGSIKLGISFENWARLGDRYIHSFGVVGKSTWLGDFHHLWLAAQAAGFGDELGDYCFEHKAAREHKFFTSPESKINYAYHFDASLYARYLRKRSEAKGVKRVEGKIGSVVQHAESGFIDAIVMDSGQRIEGDLFIDCTGFRGVLIEQTLKAGYDDWSQWLRNDSAVALQTDCPLDNIPPYTRAIAHQSGWQWKIPLQHRQGTGHVYSSAYCTDEEARKVLLNNLEGDIRVELRLLKFKTGRRRSAWVKNCVAIGLAGGFVEPLESTSIHLIQAVVARLLFVFPGSRFDQTTIDKFNAQSRNEVEEIRDFLVLHYKATERTDTAFWRHCQAIPLPDTLKSRWDMFQETGNIVTLPGELFRDASWFAVFNGQGVTPSTYHPFADIPTDAELASRLDLISGDVRRRVDALPTHDEFIRKHCAAPPLPEKVM